MEMRLYTLPLNRILYMAASLVGVILVHIALDNISKFIKEGLMKDRFNFENESFEQSEEIQENKYSVNIPMRYYYKGKFRKDGSVSATLSAGRGSWELPARVKHSVSLNRSSVSTVPRVCHGCI